MFLSLTVYLSVLILISASPLPLPQTYGKRQAIKKSHITVAENVGLHWQALITYTQREKKTKREVRMLDTVMAMIPKVGCGGGGGVEAN
jgi:hypothetical protein